MSHVLVVAKKNIKIAAARIDAAILYDIATSGSRYQTAARIDAAILHDIATSGSRLCNEMKLWMQDFFRCPQLFF